NGASTVESFTLAAANTTDHVREPGVVPLDHGRVAKEAQDSGRVAEAHKHEAQAAILVGMGNRLAAGAGAVNVRALVRAQDGKVRVGEALWRDIDVAAVGRCRSGEENGLTLCPFRKVVGERTVKLHSEDCQSWVVWRRSRGLRDWSASTR